MTLSTTLALDGRDVGMIMGVSHGPEIGAALRWLQTEVEMNPELNTLPLSQRSFTSPRPCERSTAQERTNVSTERSAKTVDKRLAAPVRWLLTLGPIATGEVYALLAIAAPAPIGLGASATQSYWLEPIVENRVGGDAGNDVNASSIQPTRRNRHERDSHHAGRCPQDAGRTRTIRNAARQRH
jgi:hypothetical protein